MDEIVEVDGQRYRIARRLDVMEQFHVTRRLGPALVVCGVTWQMMLDGVKVTLDDWVAVAGPVMEIVSKMSDEDVEYVIKTCMSALAREQQGGWAPVVASRQFMFADVDQAQMLRLVLHVLRHNLANFARGLAAGASSTAASGAAASP